MKEEAEKKQKRYIALAGINFEGLKGKPRVEVGDPVPAGLTQEQIDALLSIKAIKEAE